MKDFITKSLGLSIRFKGIEVRSLEGKVYQCAVMEYFYKEDGEAKKSELVLRENDMFVFDKTFRIEV